MRKWRMIASCILVVMLTTTVGFAGTIRRTFNWDFQGKTWATEFLIPAEAYRFFSGLQRIPRRGVGDYSIYVTDPRNDAHLESLVRSLKRSAREAGFDEWETLNFVISFVQSLTYIPDNGHRARYPIETLVHRGGDCEDTSILAAALLRQMGYSVVLLFFEVWGEGKVAHMAIGVQTDSIPGGWYWEVGGRRYFFVETAGKGWPIGVMDTPERATIIELTPIPWLELTWEVTPTQWDHHRVTYRVYVTVVNRGSGTSVGTQISVALVARPGYVWDDEESSPFTLWPFSERTFSFYLKVPRGEWTHLLVDAWSKNHMLIAERSNRFKP